MAAEEIKDLVVIEKTSVQEVFLHRPTLDGILEQIRIKALSIVPDLSTATGRKNIASVAYNVAKAKTYMDDLAKERVAELKELPKQIDESRRYMRDFMDLLKDEVRQPLTDWETEQARLEEERKAAEEAAALAKQVESDHELALLMDREWEREREEQRQAAIRAQQEREAEIAKRAAEQARIEAEQRAEAERKAAAQREIDARLAAERAERERQDAEQRARDAEARAIREKEEAEERYRRAAIKAEEDAKQAAQRAAAAERNRQESERLVAEAEQLRREADKEHKKRINGEALVDLVAAGLSDELARLAITAIAKRQVRNITINY